MAIKKKVSFSINVDPEMYLRVKKKADVENKSHSEVVRAALNQYFNVKGRL